MNDSKLRIRHTMLPVRDLDRTLDFYTRLLGMNVMRLRQQDPNTRVGYVGYGSEDDSPALELIETRGSETVPPWAGHVAIMVPDLYKLCKKLKDEGVAFTQEPNPVRPGSPDLMAHIVDPDGYAIELNERHTPFVAPSSNS